MIFLTSKCYDSDLRHSPLVYIIQSSTFYYLQVHVLQMYSTDPKLFPELQIYISNCYMISAVRYIMGISNIFKTKCLLPLPFQTVPSPGFLISIQPEAQAKNSAIIFDFSFSRSPFPISQHISLDLSLKYIPNPTTSFLITSTLVQGPFISHLNYFSTSLIFFYLLSLLSLLCPAVFSQCNHGGTCKI